MLRSRTDFEEYAQEARRLVANRTRVLVCGGLTCESSGSRRVYDVLRESLGHRQDVEVRLTGCQGLCSLGPMARIEPLGVTLVGLTPDKARELARRLDDPTSLPSDFFYREEGRALPHRSEIPFFAWERRFAARNVGLVDPGDIQDAIAHGAYQGLVRALFDMHSEEIVQVVERSGLRGRSGGGFPTGRKWRAALREKGTKKYVVCNGDEGNPGVFKDRAIMEGDPHAILEGMAIGAVAVGADEGYVYVRDEYPAAVDTLRRAIRQAREVGLLGRDIMGSGFHFDVHIVKGGGAYVCGESSALIRSLMGKAGEPRVKYAHATERGLFDRPTVLNNVETWACVGRLVADGPEEFSRLGVGKSRGTKAICLSGRVRTRGFVEVPFGVPLRTIVYEMGGGLLDGKALKAVQTGGPSGGLVPASKMDIPLDFEALRELDAWMGAGGLIVLDEDVCMVDLALHYVWFLKEESCGKCTPCREGLRLMYGYLKGISRGDAEPDVLDKIKRVATGMSNASLCDLGRSAPKPVLSAMRWFGEEFATHVRENKCPAGVCTMGDSQ